MSLTILKAEGKYLVWSVEAKAPVSYGLDHSQVWDFVRDGWGIAAIGGIFGRMIIADKLGTSSRLYDSFEATVRGNRAGPNCSELTSEEIVEKFIRNPGSLHV